MIDYIKMIKDELSGILVGNMKRLHLPIAAEVVKSTLDKYFKTLKENG